MAVICLNCEGWGCLQCKNDREAAKGGEQGLNPLEVQVEGLKARVAELEAEVRDTTWQDHADSWQKRALRAEEQLEKTQHALDLANDISNRLAAELVLVRAGGAA